MNNSPHLEEWTSLHALGLLDEAGRRELLAAAENDAEVRRMIREYQESAALLAYDAAPVAPPPALQRELMRQLSEHRAPAKVIPFRQWIPYALAACLMGLTIFQVMQIFDLRRKLHSTRVEFAELRNRNDLAQLRLAALEAKDAAYASTKIMVAWDAELHHGMISMEDMPPPPAGHDYQLWVLDPKATAPVSAGLLHAGSGTEGFAVPPVSTAGPGFAISLEPSGGRPSPTGAILFAVAPSQ
jgi:anti-sigma-K factor RskA